MAARNARPECPPKWAAWAAKSALRMEICHSHNLGRDLTAPKPWGIRVSLPPGESFTRLIGSEWERHHWFATREARDRALEDMASEHLYSRRGDRPTLVFEPVDRPHN
jgi:hypothetical protein